MKKVLNLFIVIMLLIITLGCQAHNHEFVNGTCSCGERDGITFKVVFKDFDGTILKEEFVEKNNSASAPNDPKRDGYSFIGWDQDFTNISTDLEVTAKYQPMEHTVSFYDFYGNLLKEEKVFTGDSATSPTLPEVPYHTFKEWDIDFSNVDFSMTVRPLYTYNGETQDMETANYWIQELSKKHDINKIIMTSDEIEAFNESVYSDYLSTEVVDVLKLEKTVTDTYVLNMINAYSNMSKYPVYDDVTKKQLTTSQKTEILNNRNLENISSTIEVKFGIIVDFAAMRSYPTNQYSNDYYMDRFQETALNVGEVVAVYHESSCGNWYFVQAENYNGWVEKKFIATAPFDVISNFSKNEERLVVISDMVTIEDAKVRMGQSFPLLESSSDSYKILFPVRLEDGTLLLKEVEVKNTLDFNVGYLEYNYVNLMTQAFKLLGIDYSWGDKFITGRDCSSTMNAIYRSFGFVMPRNTSNQLAIPTYGKKVNGLSPTSLKKYEPGTMIFTKSHVMLYIGDDENGKPYLLHNTTSNNGECIIQSLISYGGNNMIAVLRPYNVE